MAKKPNPFEKSKKDVERKGKGAEGSKKEEAFDKMQKTGGKMKGYATGGIMRGAGIAVKGKRFTRSA